MHYERESQRRTTFNLAVQECLYGNDIEHRKNAVDIL